jgi:putative ABC transport system permease protein
MSALIVAQLKQIGIMKSIGASTQDLVVMYLTLVLTYSILAFILAVGPAAWAAYGLTRFIAGPSMLDLNLLPFRLRPSIILLELIVSIILPLIGAIPAVIAGANTTAHEAISTHGLADNFGGNVLDQLLGRARSVTGPWILSMGNVLRNKRRVILTLGTLVLGGAVFIGVISVKASAEKTVAELGQAYRFDVEVQLSRPYRTEQIARYARQVPGVEAAEGWLMVAGALLNDLGEEGNTMQILAPPIGSALTRPKLVAGRWLLPEDENAIVIDSSLLREEPSLSVGDTLRLKINDREYAWTIVGVYQYLGVNFVYVSYANYPYVAQIARNPSQSRRLQIVTTHHDPAFQDSVAEGVTERFKELGVRVSAVETSSGLRNVQVQQFNVVVVVLTAMALLITLVGGLGLAGTMSMSVMERTREIGVMRVVGAGDGMVIRIVIVEGLLIALLSWLMAIILAWPVGVMMSQVIGRELVNGPLSYQYSAAGMVIWLILVLLTALLASYAPARQASNLTVRDVLAYE